jgi:hypothetical protein
MHTTNISYPCEYQRACDAHTELTRAGAMLDALGLALHHGDVEDHARDELGFLPAGTASDLDEMLVEVVALGAFAVGEVTP